MKCVTNTSPISWLERIGRLELLAQVYDEIYAPKIVFEQLAPHYPTRSFVKEHLKPLQIDPKELEQFNDLSIEWLNRLNVDDVGEVAVFVAYRFFLDVDEMLYANKGAETAISPYGSVRDIANLYEVAEEKGIFTRADSIEFLEGFLRIKPPYGTLYVQHLLKKLKD